MKNITYPFFILIAISAFYVSLYGIPFMEEEETFAERPASLIPTPYIRVDGSPIETIYQNGFYTDPGAEIMEVIDGEIKCSGIFIKGSGVLNTKVPGIYVLEYKAEDAQGKTLPTITRTIEVIENDAAFLNGIYNVACTCTAFIGSAEPVITKTDYIACVSSGSKNFEFQLNKLHIGPADVIPYSKLNKDRIEAFYYLQDIDAVKSSVSGTLSSTKNTFTIESIALKTFPYETYSCVNVFRNTKWRSEKTK